MTTADVLVIIGGLALIAGIAWFFWGPRRGGYRTAVTSSGYQEARMLMKGGCTPDVIQRCSQRLILWLVASVLEPARRVFGRYRR